GSINIGGNTALGDVTSTTSDGIYAVASGGGITVDTTDGSVSGYTSGVSATTTSDGDIDITVSGAVSGGTGAGIDTDGTIGSLTEIALNSGATVSAVSGLAIRNTYSDSVITVGSGAIISGAIQLGSGSDTLTFDGGDFSAVTSLDGGDDVSDADGFSDTLNLNGVSGVLTGANLTGWEQIALASGSAVSFADSSLTTGRFALNAGTQLSFQNNSASDEFILAGNFSGGGLISVDVDFATDISDLFTVTGDVTGDTTTIALNDISSGTLTGNDVVVVNVGGDASSDSFALAQPVRSGVFLYDLEQQGSDFVLESNDNFVAETAGLEAIGFTLLSLNELAPLRERLKQREFFGGPDVSRGNVSFAETAMPSHTWIHFANSHDKFTPESSATNYDAEVTNFSLRAGVEYLAYEGTDARLSFGLNGFYGEANANITSATGNGSLDTNYFGVGLTSTWQHASGFYVDGQVQYINYDNQITTTGLPTEFGGDGFSAAIELGQAITLQNSDWVLTPSVQLAYSSVEYDSFIDSSGLLVSSNQTDSLKLRMGLSGDKISEWETASGLQREEISIFGNLHFEQGAEHDVLIAGSPLKSRLEGKSFEVGLGYMRSVDDDRMSVFMQTNFTGALENASDNYGLEIKLGGQFTW
ncbi:MAG: autotransporter outer membrane beta-barrel domain-containing protein, partial [Litoreibacter sp.]|uniref:autotransporter outer membrane beta-barrel domain-containing protein n=1 Tax=Litoreibacter sp. TaxID=1969459 RepID=UPI00329A1BD4